MLKSETFGGSFCCRLGAESLEQGLLSQLFFLEFSRHLALQLVLVRLMPLQVDPLLLPTELVPCGLIFESLTSNAVSVFSDWAFAEAVGATCCSSSFTGSEKGIGRRSTHKAVIEGGILAARQTVTIAEVGRPVYTLVAQQ